MMSGMILYRTLGWLFTFAIAVWAGMIVVGALLWVLKWTWPLIVAWLVWVVWSAVRKARARRAVLGSRR